VRLGRCDLAACEALCCHDGAYVEPDDEERIGAARAAYPEFFHDMPAEAIVEENWRGLGAGRKTATRPWTYRRQIPAHFPATRCVFADGQGWCRLESAARAHGLHPWTFKPVTCFLFPLADGDPASGPATPGRDPFDLGPDYPGFATVVDCGRHQPAGRPWHEVLRDELAMLDTPVDAYFAAWQQRPPSP
jgi:hypothetical protein